MTTHATTTPTPSLTDQLEHLTQGAQEVIDPDTLLHKLQQSQAENRPLIIKAGLDPSAPDLHLGHAVLLRKARQFQQYGHRVVIVIGDFTGRIGDPTGRSKTRPALTPEQVEANAHTYREQLSHVLDPALTEVVLNSDWLAALSFEAIVRLCGHTTVARILERDDFTTRHQAQHPIGLHEFLYPLMQAYDSVHLHADVELGGMDQRFNILMGRTIQRDYHQEPQAAMFVPLLTGLDGKEKMSKSLNNYVGLYETAEHMQEKLMRLPDALIPDFFRLATDLTPQAIQTQLARLEHENPRDVKLTLAQAIITLYHGPEATQAAQTHWTQLYTQDQLPQDMPVLHPTQGTTLPELLVQAGWFPSISQARRMLAQGAVRWNREKVYEGDTALQQENGVLQMGKRFVQVEWNRK